ncbi:unnamed protein product, partial [marine sediment metagenome]
QGDIDASETWAYRRGNWPLQGNLVFLDGFKDITNHNQLTFSKIPEAMLHILDEGGLIPY